MVIYGGLGWLGPLQLEKDSPNVQDLPKYIGREHPPEMFRRRFTKLSSLVILEDAFTLLSAILPSQDITSGF